MEFKFLKRFSLKVILLTSLIILLVEATYRIVTVRVAKNAFPAALVDKHNYAKSISSPKVVLLGGSNVAFGFNSPQLSKRLGMPVVNMALLAPLGIEYILSDAQAYIKQGDIVILSFEYNIGVKGDIESQLYAADFIPENKNFISDTSGLTEKWKSRILHRLHAPVKIETVLENPRIEDPFSIYFRGAFTKEGDIVSHLNNYKGNVHDDGGKVSSFHFQPHIETLNRFTKQFEDKGAKVYYLYPTVAESFYRNTEVAVHELAGQMDEKIHAKILAKPLQSVFPDSSCFDTVFHLNGPARDIHTENVASALLRIGI